MDAAGTEKLNEVRAVGGSLVNRLFEHDHTRDVFFDLRGGEKELAVVATVGFVVLDGDLIESLSNSSCGLVSCQDSFAGGRNFAGSLNEFFSKVLLCVNHC